VGTGEGSESHFSRRSIDLSTFHCSAAPKVGRAKKIWLGQLARSRPHTSESLPETEPVPSECSGFAAKASFGCHDNAIFLRIGHSRIHSLGRSTVQAGSWEQPRRLHDGYCRRLKTPKLSLDEPQAHTETMRGFYSSPSHYLTLTSLSCCPDSLVCTTPRRTQFPNHGQSPPRNFQSGPFTFVASRSETIGPLLADSSGMWLASGGPVE
jgi:hypothetical protein